MSPALKTETLRRLARQGLLRARDLDAAAIPRAYLRRLSDRGELVRVDRGLYRLVDAPVTELTTLAEVAKRIPRGVICLLSALQLHELTTEAPHAVWIQVDRHDRAPSFRHPHLEIVRASGAARTHGIEMRTIEGVRVMVTSAAKTVADCFRYRHRVGMEVALAALRDYLASRRKYKNRTIDALVAAAQADRVHTFMRPYLEALS
jgi:predicted transcriptional regulator of viral defense system